MCNVMQARPCRLRFRETGINNLHIKPGQSESFPGASAAPGSSTSLIARRFFAFTLVELLVVISIIALLLAILLPAMNKAKQTAVAIKCQANLHQIGLAHSAYQSENNGCLASGWTISGFYKLWPYMGAANDVVGTHISPIYNCPLMPQGLAGWNTWSSFGINGYLGGPAGGDGSETESEVVSKPYRISSVLYPSGKIYAADYTRNSRLFWQSIALYNPATPSVMGDLDARHPGSTCNMLFLDSHAAAIPSSLIPSVVPVDFNKWLKINAESPNGL